MTLADLIIRDVCEADADNPEDPEVVSISVDHLHRIIDARLEPMMSELAAAHHALTVQNRALDKTMDHLELAKRALTQRDEWRNVARQLFRQAIFSSPEARQRIIDALPEIAVREE